MEKNLDVIIYRQPPPLCITHFLALGFITCIPLLIKSQLNPDCSVRAAVSNFQVDKDKGILKAYCSFLYIKVI